MTAITLIDWGIWLVYFTLIFLLLFIYRNTKTESYYRFFLKAFVIKVIGGIGFALVYVYYYKFGDTFFYHQGATAMAEHAFEAPAEYLRLLFTKGGDIPNDLKQFTDQIAYSRTFEEWFMVKLLSPINLISFQSYLVTTLFMSLLSFLGGWKLFLVFRDILPSKEKYAFWAVFLVPSVIFWGGGIMKDTITLCGMNYILYLLYFGAYKKKVKWSYMIGVIVISYFIFSLKAYVIIAYLPGIILGFYIKIKNRITSSFLRVLSGPVILASLLVLSYLSLSQVSGVSEKYKFERLEGQVKGFHSWHTDVGGSTYSLGEIDYSPSGVLRKVPAALNVTFFRPYLWEARNPVVLIGALESLFLLLVFLYVVYKYKFRILNQLRSQPLLYGTFFYCLIFGFAVGFTSYNFGALARYKIPIMSLFTFILFYLIYKLEVKGSPYKTLLSD
jgi:hypothetical protein